MMEIPLLDNKAPVFPSPEEALLDPNGLLAAGGNLAPATLIKAYQQGIFPWYSEDEPILWWSPDPRMVLFLDKLHVSKRLLRTIRRKNFEIRFDTCFEDVTENCVLVKQKKK